MRNIPDTARTDNVTHIGEHGLTTINLIAFIDTKGKKSKGQNLQKKIICFCLAFCHDNCGDASR